MANKKIQEVEGIGPAYATKLEEAGITHTDKLLDACKTKKGRKEMADTTGISEKQILKWTNMVDLFRIKGVGAEYAELLEAAGVDTVKELKHRNAVNLAAKMIEINEQKKLTRRVPNAEMVEGWVNQAKELPGMIEH